MMKFNCFVLLSMLISNIYCQENDKNFNSPLDIPLVINGTFAELRSNHFHSGIDFATQRKNGFPVYAVEDGVVNRIKVSTYGFGKVIYMRHPSGYTTVYAHLDNFEKRLQSYVRKNQYEKESYEIELFPLGDEFTFKKGDLIGYTGNTGSSGGPHLHFEVKDTETEKLHNPFLLGMFKDVVDTQKPVVNALWVYPKHKDVLIHGVASEMPINFKRMNNGDYLADKIVTNGEIGLGVNTYDVVDNSNGKNGVYELILKVNGNVINHIKFDEFTYDESRYVNYLIDYKKFAETNQRVQKLFQKNNISIPFVKKAVNNGFLNVEENSDYQITIEVNDFHNNSQKIHIPVSYKSFPKLDGKSESNKIYIDFYRDYIFEENDKYVSWKAQTFYEDLYLDIQLLEDAVILGKDIYPIHDYIDIRFNVENNNINKEKTFIGRVEDKKIHYYETWKRDNDFRIRTKNLGTFKLIEDTKPPTVTNVVLKSHFKNTDELTFEIQDELSGIGKYRGEINGKWALFEYDFKTKKLTHKLNEGVALKGNNKLILEIKDKIGNNTTFEYSFTLE